MDWEYLRKVGLSLATAARNENDAAIQKWALKALTLVTPEPDDTTEVFVRTKALTYDEEHDLLIAAQDEILKAKGRPYGHEGTERGATTLGEVIDICERLDLPLHLAEYRAMVVPGTAQ